VDGVTRQSPSTTALILPVALQVDEATAFTFSTAALAGNKNAKKIKKDDARIFI
jgi:hypothetical protein